MWVFYLLVPTVIVMTIALAHAIVERDLNMHIIKREEEALLEFKKGFKNPSNLLSSWDTRRDFCTWAGVECTDTTGHVISLDLHNTNSLDKLQGKLSSSLLDLPYLSSLDLSGNDFMQYQVPAFLGSIQNLKHLNLSDSNFKGVLPDNLGNLSQLESLDLSHNDFMQSQVPAFLGSMQSLKHLNLSGANFRGKLSDNLGNLSRLESLDLSHNNLFLAINLVKWLHGVSSLRSLDLSGVDISTSANDWFRAICMLPSLVILRLSGCQLHSLPPSPPKVNFDSLTTLDLSHNYFDNTIPDWLFENCHNLQHLNLSNNQLQGPIPDSIGRLMSLVAVDLSNNNLNGSIPSTLGQAGTNSSLKELHLSNNQLTGSLERSVGQLSDLVVLDLADNNLEGNITDAHLANFPKLRVLDLSSNRVTLNVSKNWVPPFQLETIGLGNCQLGPQFPNWIQTQKSLSHINISHAGVSDTVPNWFWDLSPSIEHIDLSSNELRGCGRDFSSKLKLETLDLSNNRFSCPLPHLPPNMKFLNLATNSFYGTISHVCELLGVNNSLGFLDVSSNNLSGNLPNCWTYGRNLIILNLADNTFSGSIPESLGSLTNLHKLTMNGNYLCGNIPEAMKNCTGLIVLDLGSNQLSGQIPYWIGEEMQILKALILSENSFEGNIPTVLCQLKSLQILDLSMNQLTGAIPRCVFAAMATGVRERSYVYDPYVAYRDQLRLTTKGRTFLYSSRILPYVNLLDLSSNHLTEDIPVEITKLIGLVGLNLSSNQLVGSIPSDIGEVESLEVLDLSRNKLSCTIPNSIVDLHNLSFLNLSHNNLSGQIPPPQGQLLTFDPTTYSGNPNLCGVPLEKACSRNESYEDPLCKQNDGIKKEHGNADGLQIPPFYLSAVAGFICGFWAFWIPLCCSRSWRHAYFRFLGHMNDKVYVMVAVSVARLQTKFRSWQAPQ